ncbi:hypothetical protein [Nocardia sp. NPDC058705]|uniref:hypothetical protein n=1 Tax=Nocardia sp. NPDC058705 TaxID=3346609 RepID=UPI0036B4C4EB
MKISPTVEGGHASPASSRTSIRVNGVALPTEPIFGPRSMSEKVPKAGRPRNG